MLPLVLRDSKFGLQQPSVKVNQYLLVQCRLTEEGKGGETIQYYSSAIAAVCGAAAAGIPLQQ